MAKPKVIGKRGSWFAEVGGERLPCIHDHWLKKMHYIDPGVVVGNRQWDEYIAAIKERQIVILTLDKMRENGAFQRTGYAATYSVSNVTVTEAGLEMDLVQRLIDVA